MSDNQLYSNYQKFISRLVMYRVWKESGTPLWVWHKWVEYTDLPFYKRVTLSIFWGTLPARLGFKFIIKDFRIIKI